MTESTKILEGLAVKWESESPWNSDLDGIADDPFVNCAAQLRAAIHTIEAAHREHERLAVAAALSEAAGYVENPGDVLALIPAGESKVSPK